MGSLGGSTPVSTLNIPGRTSETRWAFLQSLGGKLRKAIRAKPPASQALPLARLWLNLEDRVSSATLGVIAEAVEEARRHAPDATRVFLEDVLKRPEMREYPRQRCRLALAYVGSVKPDASPRVWREAFEECFAAAIEANDPEGTLAALQSRVNLLLETGAQREAEAELRHALALLEHLPEARLNIQTQIARVWTYQGDLPEARSLLEDVLAESLALRIETPLADSTLNGVLATQLDPSARGRLRQQFRDAVRQDDHGEASIAAALGAGLAFIHGDGDEARLPVEGRIARKRSNVRISHRKRRLRRLRTAGWFPAVRANSIAAGNSSSKRSISPDTNANDDSISARSASRQFRPMRVAPRSS